MRVNELKLMRRFNLGNYEHKEILVSCAVGENEDVHAVFNEMESFVKSRFSSELVESLVIKEETKAVEKVEVKAEEPKVEETEVKAEETKAEKKPRGKRTGKAVTTPYNRLLEEHKKLFGSVLDTILPGWRVKDSVEKSIAVNASMALNNVPFLDSEGEILESFLETAKDFCAT